MEIKKCELLAEKIREIFQKNLNISDDVRHYIDSTFSSTSSADVEKIINDDDNCEKDSLMELLFFPDESIQVKVENILENHDFQTQDQEKVMKYLFLNPIEAVIGFPDKNELRFPVPEWAAGRFISRLKIDKKIDHRILDAINSHVDESLRDVFKVRIRNSRFIQTDKKVFFLCNFFEKINAPKEDMPGLMNFISLFLDEIKEENTIFKALMDKKKALFRSLEQAARFEKQMKKSNMETLMLQGVRTPHINPDDARKKTSMIDQISYAVFGRSEHIV